MSTPRARRMASATKSPTVDSPPRLSVRRRVHFPIGFEAIGATAEFQRSTRACIAESGVTWSA